MVHAEHIGLFSFYSHFSMEKNVTRLERDIIELILSKLDFILTGNNRLFKVNYGKDYRYGIDISEESN